MMYSRLFSGIYFAALQFWYSTWPMLWSWHTKF